MLLVSHLFVLQDENLQLLKEEKVDGAIYSIYVKKVNYHTSLYEERDAGSTVGSKCANSTFYADLPVQSRFTVEFNLALHLLMLPWTNRLYRTPNSNPNPFIR